MVVSVAQAQQFFLAFTRIMAIVVYVPVLGGQAIPAQVRIGLGLVLSAILVPWQPLVATAPVIPDFVFIIAIGKELLIGTLAGFAAALTFGAVQVAGEVMGLGSGFGAGRILNPASGESGSALDQLFVMVAMLLFVALNGHHTFLIAVQKTFIAIPVNSPLPGFTSQGLIELFARLVAAGVQMALPVLGALLLTDITLGLLARVAPQVQVFFLGLPLKLGVAMIALSMTFVVSLPSLSNLFVRMAPRMLALLGR
ncbi:MAG: flagellar biosynthetic protein FliR [Anaerolineaceae bacterium]|nr:flagellar biosynthetic protein FliR [Anaerolineaceae bacterium]